jgi:hypothetical protein
MESAECRAFHRLSSPELWAHRERDDAMDSRARMITASPLGRLAMLRVHGYPAHPLMGGRGGTLPAGTVPPGLREDAAELVMTVLAAIDGWRWSPQLQALARALDPEDQCLLLTAEATLDTPAAGWWEEPVRRHQQVALRAPSDPLHPAGTRFDFEELHNWASKPITALSTFTALPGLPLQLMAEAWELVDISHVEGWRVGVTPDAGVYEIRDPSDWITLCLRYPQDATANYKRWWPEWGVDGTQIIVPDWASVASDWDGVHLTMVGLLTTEGLPLSLDGSTTLLEG